MNHLVLRTILLLENYSRIISMKVIKHLELIRNNLPRSKLKKKTSSWWYRHSALGRMLQIHSLAGVFMLYYQQYHQHRCPSLFTVSLSFRRSTVDRHEHSGEDLAGSCHPLDHKRLELNLVCLCLKLKSNFNS